MEDQDQSDAYPRIDLWTLVGLALLVLPLLTMGHELAGHALTCLGLGHAPSQLGAYYVECPGTSGWGKRLVAMAGTGMDVVLAMCGYLAWRQLQAPLPRLAAWMVFAVKGMVAAGYWMFSGLTNLGDWGPAAGGGIGALPWPWLCRLGLFAVGLVVYVAVTRRAIDMLRAMLGGGMHAWRTQRTVALTTYVVGGVSAVLVSLLNPLGLVITLVSAVASSFGGTAGLFNVAYARRRSGPASAFVIARRPVILVLGLVVTLLFAAVLGPTIHLAG